MQTLGTYLDHYCERVVPGLWDEPLNVISNIGFFIVAYFLWQKVQQEIKGGIRPYLDILILLILIVIIGVGSSLWHIYASGDMLWADRIPILLFIGIYLLSCLLRILQLPLWGVIGLFILFCVLNIGVQVTLGGDFLNRSIFYLPAWLFLLSISVVIWKQGKLNKRYFLWSVPIFSLAIVFRTIDQNICPLFPLGTHFVWHLLVAGTIFLLMAALLKIE